MMLQRRTIFYLWCGLMLYAATQAALVARGGSAPFFGVLLFNFLIEHLRLLCIIGILWYAGKYAQSWRIWRQAALYSLWVLFTSLALITVNFLIILAWGKEQTFTGVWNNKHWILIQGILENALIIVGFVVVQYRREIAEREERERELRHLNTQMELAMLRAQLNPHFLFNALNTVNALVSARPDDARRVLEMLSGLLRYTLESHNRDFVLLRDELDFVQKYLAIEQERFGRRLQSSIDVEEKLLEVMLPPMLLQPLVENAVKHGIAPKASGGEVRVRIVADEAMKQLRVEVCDNGLGFKESVSPHSTGIGLANMSARLQKLFGKDSALEVENSEYGVKAHFLIPIKVIK